MFYNTNYHALGFAACYQRDARIIHELLRAALYEQLHDNYMLNRNHPELLFNRH